MRFERRRQSRRPIDIAAKLFTAVDAPVWDCIVMDISDCGARLAVESGGDIPDHFTLLLSAEGRASRRCQVMWRAGRQMGVKFVPLESANADLSQIFGAEPDFR
jgi:hypothetical protein